MGRPRGSKNKPKTGRGVSLEDFNATFDDKKEPRKQITNVVEAPDDDEENGTIIPVNLDKTFGIQIGKFGPIVWRRVLYKKDTVTQFPVKGGGMEQKLYKAGSYSDWDKMNRAWFRTVESAFEYIVEKMLQEKIRETESVINLAKIAKEVKEEIKHMLTIGVK